MKKSIKDIIVSTTENESIKNSKVNNCKLYFEDFKLF